MPVSSPQLNVSPRNNLYMLLEMLIAPQVPILPSFFIPTKSRLPERYFTALGGARQRWKLVNAVIFWRSASLETFSKVCLTSLIKKHKIDFFLLVLISLNWSPHRRAMATIKRTLASCLLQGGCQIPTLTG